MKSKDFLILVGEMRREQKQYYATRKHYPREARDHLVWAKQCEQAVDAVIREGRLEPDIVTTTASAEEQRQLRLHLEDERDAGEA